MINYQRRQRILLKTQCKESLNDNDDLSKESVLINSTEKTINQNGS